MEYFAGEAKRKLAHTRRIIDDAGEVVPCHEQILGRRLASSLSGPVLIDYAIMNLGWVEIGDGNDHFRIRCRPRLVNERTLGGLLYALHDTGASRISLSVFGADWQHSIHRASSDIAFIISGMSQGQTIAKSSSQHAWMRRQISSGDSPLQAGFRAFVAGTEKARSIDDLIAPLNAAFRGRWSIGHVEPSAVIMDCVGPGFVPYNPHFFGNAAGANLDLYAEDGYGAWVSEIRHEVAHKQVVVFDDVDAVVRFPRLGETRLRYSRCIAPASLRNGISYVISASCVNSAINLRNQA